MSMNKFNPDYRSTSGEILKEIIESRKISNSTLAKKCKCSIRSVVKMINDRMAITPKMAKRIQLATNISSELLLNLSPICVVCEKRLTGHQLRYCSRLCTRRHQNKSLYVGKHTKKCDFCLKDFEAKIKGGKFCSAECRKNAYYKKMGYAVRYKKMDDRKICDVCGKRFKINSVNQKHCSAECHRIYRSEKDTLMHNFGTTDVSTDDKKYMAGLHLGRKLLLGKLDAHSAIKIKKAINKGETYEAYR